MASSVWYNHFQGATYPVNFATCRQHLQVCRKLKTLVQITSAYIVQDSTMTQRAVSILPQNLCTSLLEQAIEKEKDRAILVLLSRWPDKTLLLRKMTPPLYNSLRILYDQKILASTVMKGVRFTTCLAHNYMETLKKKSDTKLKFLDISGYPTAEVIVFYLATHCMLVHNEARQRVMIQNYKAAIERFSEANNTSNQHLFTEDQTLPDGTFAVKLDAFVTSDKTLFELCKALKVSSFENTQFKLIIETLDVTCLGQQKISLLLELLETQYLLGLRLKYNSINPGQFRTMAPDIQRFSKLTSLDLSCNCINVYISDLTCTILATTLAALPNLVRLDLSNNRLKSKLRRTLSGIVKSLQFLRLLACGLTEEDVEYLSESHHTQALQELYLSENGLGRSIVSLLRLLKATQLTLRILELEDALLSDTHILSLMSSNVLSEFKNLMYLNIAGNRLTLDVTLATCVNVCRIHPLQYLWIAFPVECYQQITNKENEQLSNVFVENSKAAILKERERLHLTHCIPFLVITELEPDIL